MMKKIRLNCTATLDETFADFLLSRRAKGLAEKTLESYSSQWKAVAQHLDTETDIVTLQKADLDDMIVSMRDAGLTALLKKPDIRKTTFAEYRDWVIINFLLNCGSRAATVRAIQIRDVDLDGGVVFYRHTKNRKAQVIPLCSPMIAILREYGRYRGGEPTDYLFTQKRVHSSRRTACGNLSQGTTCGEGCKKLLFTCSATHSHGNI